MKNTKSFLRFLRWSHHGEGFFIESLELAAFNILDDALAVTNSRAHAAPTPSVSVLRGNRLVA